MRLRRPLPLRRFAPCVLRWKTLRVSSAPHPAGFESRRMGSKKARYREGNGLLNSNGAPSGMSACGCAARFRCGASRLACCAGKRCAFPQLRTLPGSNPGPWAAKKPATRRVTGFSIQMVPPAGFEPAISTLKGWRPWPLDDGDSAVEYTRYLVCEKPIFHVNSYC